MTRSAPIGIFDSGCGGLSVLREIRALLPHESLLYIADSAHVPYGSRSPEWIRDRSLTLSDELIKRGAKAIVIACNTATAAGAAAVREAFPTIPVIGMEPAVKPAVAATKRGIIGVLATVGTVQSARFAALLGQFASNVTVVTQPAPGLPECVERGELQTPETRALVAQYVTPLKAAGADVIVLGCTHYPFLRDLIQQEVGPEVTLIDTGAAVAKQVQRRLQEANLRNPSNEPGNEAFLTSHSVTALTPILQRLWGHQPDSIGHLKES